MFIIKHWRRERGADVSRANGGVLKSKWAHGLLKGSLCTNEHEHSNQQPAPLGNGKCLSPKEERRPLREGEPPCCLGTLGPGCVESWAGAHQLGSATDASCLLPPHMQTLRCEEGSGNQHHCKAPRTGTRRSTLRTFLSDRRKHRPLFQIENHKLFRVGGQSSQMSTLKKVRAKSQVLHLKPRKC